METQPNDTGILAALHRYALAPRLQRGLLLPYVSPQTGQNLPAQALHLISTGSAGLPREVSRV